MALLAAECGESDETADFDDPKTPEEAQALAREHQAVDALVSAMAGRGLAPPTDSGLGLRDYVTIAWEAIPTSRRDCSCAWPATAACCPIPMRCRSTSVAAKWKRASTRRPTGSYTSRDRKSTSRTRMRGR